MQKNTIVKRIPKTAKATFAIRFNRRACFRLDPESWSSLGFTLPRIKMLLPKRLTLSLFLDTTYAK